MATLEISCYRINGPEQICTPAELGNSDSYTIGRSPSCSYVVSGHSDRVSRRQCTLTRTGERWTITDGNGEHSTGGTLLNGRELTTAPLRNGDVIEFPARPVDNEDVWRWRFTYRSGPPLETTPDETVSQEVTLIQKPQPKYLPWVALGLLALAIVLLRDFAINFVDGDQKLSPKELLELAGAGLAGAGALALKWKS